jgi:hypothetical protein
MADSARHRRIATALKIGVLAQLALSPSRQMIILDRPFIINNGRAMSTGTRRMRPNGRHNAAISDPASPMAHILNLLGVAITLLIGLWGIVRPESMAKTMGFSLHGRRGRAEFRIGFGGVLLGLTGYALYLRADLVFAAIGAIWFGAAATRVLALFLDRPPFNASYVAVFLFELAMGWILIY